MYRWKKVVGTWVLRHKKQLFFVVGGILAVIVVGQLLYPASRLLPFTQVDTVAVGGWQKKDVIRELDRRYAATETKVYFGKAETAYRAPKPGDMKLGISNEQRIEAINYPWYLRVTPGSILWAHLVTK